MAIREVLTVRGLCHFISEYQVGIQQDLIPFQSFSCGSNSHLESFECLFEPWLSQYGITRVALLFHGVLGMEELVGQYAAKYQHLDLLQRYHQYFDSMGYDRLVMIAIKHGHLKLLKYFETIGALQVTPSTNSRSPLYAFQTHQRTCFIDEASTYGHLHLVTYLHQNQLGQCTTSAINNAAKNGHLHVLEFLHKNRNEGCTTDALLESVSNGHLEIVKFLLANYFECGSYAAMQCAAERGQLNVLKYLLSVSKISGLVAPPTVVKRYPSKLSSNELSNHVLDKNENQTIGLMDLAASSGQLQIVQYLHAHGKTGCTTYAMNEASRNGFFHVVQYLHTNRLEGCTQDAMDGAIGNGHLEIVKYLSLHFKLRADENSVYTAIQSGHFDVVKFCTSEYQLKGSRLSLSYACYTGHLDMVKYFYNPDMTDFIPEAIQIAESCKHYGVVQYLVTLCTPEFIPALSLEQASETGDVNIVKWIYHLNKGQCIRRGINKASSCGYLDVVDFLLSVQNKPCSCIPRSKLFYHSNVPVDSNIQRASCASEAIDHAVTHGRLNIVKYMVLRKAGSPKFEMAVRFNHLPIVRFMVENCSVDSIDLDSGIKTAMKCKYDLLLKYLRGCTMSNTGDTNRVRAFNTMSPDCMNQSLHARCFVN